MRRSLRRAIWAEPLFFLVVAVSVLTWSWRLRRIPGAFVAAAHADMCTPGVELASAIGSDRTEHVRRIAAACQAYGRRTGLWDCRARALGVATAGRVVLGINLPVRLAARRRGSEWTLHLYVDGIDRSRTSGWTPFCRT